MATISGWTEGIILSLVFLTVLSLIVVAMNYDYGKNNVLPFNDNSGSEALFIKYQDTAATQITGGEAVLDAQQGITLKSSWGLTKDVTSVVWSFISGGWIEQVIDAWGLGEAGSALAKGLRILYFLSLVFAILYGLFKVVL